MADPTEPHGYRAGARAGLPLVLPTLVVGASFGVLARSLGWGTVAPIVCSLVVFAGSAQFALASVLGAGGSVLAAVVAAALVNSRFGPMGLAVAPGLRGGRLRRAVEGQAVIDASLILASREGRVDRELLLGVTLTQWLAWQSGTVLGTLGGGLLGDPDALGLDAVFPAFFLVLLVGEATDARSRAAAVAAAALTFALVPLVPPGVPVTAACAVALIGLVRR